MLKEWQKDLERIKEENINFCEEINSLSLNITIQELSLLEKGIKKINQLPADYPICLTLEKQQQALRDHKNSKNEAVLGRISPLHRDISDEALLHINSLSGKEVFNFILKLVPSSKDVLINRSIFFCNTLHLCEEPDRLKKDQEALANSIDRLLEESQTLEESEVTKRFFAIQQRFSYNKQFLENFKSYNEIFKKTYICIKEFITQNNKLADEVEQALKALLSNTKWDNKAVKFTFKIFSVPDNIKKMRAILGGKFSHERKMFEIAKIVKQQAQQPRLLRNKEVQQLYQQLSGMFKQYYPDLWKMDDEQQDFSDFIFYDKDISTKLIQTMQNAIAPLNLTFSAS